MNKGIGIFLSFILFGVVLLANELFRDDLFVATIGIVLEAQRAATPMRIFLMKYLISDGIAIPSGIFAIIGLFFASRPKGGLCFNILIMYTTVYLGLLKDFFHCSRPFWVDGDIQAWGFEIGFGSPSGHAMTALTLIPSLILLFMVQNKDMGDIYIYKETIFGQFMRYLGIGVLIGFMPLVLISRVYLGSHSIDQVLFGGLLGALFVFAVFYLLREILIAHFYALFNIPRTLSTSPYSHMGDKSTSSSSTQVLIGVLFYAFFIGIEIVEYLYIYPDAFIPPNQMHNIQQWKPEIIDPRRPLLSSSNKYGDCGAGMGFYIGIYLAYKLFNPDFTRWGLKTSTKNYLLRILVVLGLGAIPAALIFFIIPENHIYWIKSLKYFLLYTLTSISIFTFSDYLCQIWHLLPEDSNTTNGEHTMELKVIYTTPTMIQF